MNKPFTINSITKFGVPFSFVLAFLAASSLHGLNTYSLPGTTDFDAWDNLTVTNPQVAAANSGPGGPAGGYGVFPGSGPWPAPIESVLTQGTSDTGDDDLTGDATFNKLFGNGYPAGISIYASPFGPRASYEVSDDTPLAGLETVIFQLQIGSGSLPGFFLQENATLIINETTEVPFFAATFEDLGAQNTGFGPVIVGQLSYQWDLRGLGSINSFDVNFRPAGTSSTITALQLDQGDIFAAAVPEPSFAALIFGLGAIGLVARRRRR
ncbi:MAG: PEP-CTERM sorting domain-containing protein [Verrucomicrobiota bacterium]